MKHGTKLLFAGLSMPTVLLFAFSAGPPQARTGAEVDGGLACNACHRGADLNSPGGRLTITVNPYTPGVKQTIQVRLEHPEASRWGFQLTARLDSDKTRKAGTFTPSNDVRVRCGLTGAQDAPCGDAVEFASHTQASTNASTRGGRTWEIEWTPPASAAGPIVFYAAGNAADNSGNNTGDRVYTTSVTVQPAAGGPRPAINRGGVVEGFNFTSGGISSQTWLAIFGSNLAPATRTWDDAIRDGVLPTTLSGVSVKINNRDAPIFFVSPEQVNVLAPVDDAVGDVNVVVSNANGDSDPIVVRRASASPAFFAPFSQNNRLFVLAVATDGTLVGKVGAGSAARRAARPGETILLFGTGFGATNPAAPADRVVTGAPALVTKPVIRIGETVVDFPGNGNLVAAGLYQFNVTIPATLADGDYPIVAEIGGVRSASTVSISVAR